ncbi:UV-B-induced protein At3g17800, chloroplastic [Rhodamnia argentea]|uniref:UV-B-induced protein At3g17800, chloroplastic n=1 Tax=Rhodamnia argentea TaxID=178133 RepID=A0A8B8QNF8_9MYRT|nr:UV-B-induced protein At3g17800, chloroplastic [Rhodamnia argentea]
MDSSLLPHSTRTPPPPFLPPAARRPASRKFLPQKPGASARIAGRRPPRRSLTVVAGASHCESSSLNTPLVPESAPGKYLTGVLQNQRQLFHVAVAEELKQLAEDRDAAVSRVLLSAGSDEVCLHRRIAEIKERDRQVAIKDVMYMFILYKFSEIRVHLVPKLSRCIYNGRLEIWPAKDWELESIHGIDVLEMIKEHVAAVIGLRADSSVTDNWATTHIQRLQLGRLYAASVLYGYFLKSASLRHHLECSLALSHQGHQVFHKNSLESPKLWPYGWNNLVCGCFRNDKLSLGQAAIQDRNHEKLRCYVMGFDPETLQRCAKVRSREAIDLIEKHSCALFGDGKMGLISSDDIILTSFSSLKRLVLEAVAFGAFLWDVEEHVDAVYKLNDN